MIISLDRNALASLIQSDKGFELSLKSAVLSEVARRFFEKDAARVIRNADAELFDKALSAYQRDKDMAAQVSLALEQRSITRERSWTPPVISMEVRQLINAAVEKAMAHAVDDAVSAVEGRLREAYRERVGEIVAGMLDPVAIETRINNRVETILEAEIDRRVDGKVREKVAALNAVLRS